MQGRYISCQATSEPSFDSWRVSADPPNQHGENFSLPFFLHVMQALVTHSCHGTRRVLP